MNQVAFDLSGQVAVVTGGTSGIGQAVCRRLHAAGAMLVNLDLAPATWDVHGTLAMEHNCDVSREQDVAEAIKATIQSMGRLDILVNNAGVFTSETVETIEEAALMKNLTINLGGVVWGTKHGSRAMTSGGAIVNVASHAGLRGVPGYPAYAASKAAIIAYTKTAALELAHRGIRVNCVCPGTTETPMAADPEGALEVESAELLIPLGRLGRAEEQAAAVHFLASNDCAFVTGQALAIDGGKSAGPGQRMLEVLQDVATSSED